MATEFGGLSIDATTQKILKDNQPLSLSHKAAQLLRLLIVNAPNITSKQDIFDDVWSGRVVTENTLYKTISRLRAVLNPEHMDIESVFGEGYRLIETQPDGEAQSSTPKTRRQIYVTGLLVLLMTLALMAFYHSKATPNLYQDMQALESALSTAKQAFISQLNRRNELGGLLTQRFEIDPNWSWEKRFYHYHDQMNDEERFVCQQIRAYSEGPIRENNQKALDIISTNPKVIKAIPTAQQLLNHLSIWLNKYHKVFENNPRMCLIYVGVEDGAPFPSEFDQLLADWLQANQP